MRVAEPIAQILPKRRVVGATFRRDSTQRFADYVLGRHMRPEDPQCHVGHLGLLLGECARTGECGRR